MHAHAFPPGTICILLHFKVPVLPPRKETNGVKEFTSQVSEAAGLSGFICCRGLWGAGQLQWDGGSIPGAAGDRGSLPALFPALSWCPGSEVQWWMETHVSGCARCQHHLSQGGLSGKTTLQGQPQTGSSAAGTLRSGLGVGSRSSHPALPWPCRVLVLPLLLCQLPARSLWGLTGRLSGPRSPCGAPSLLLTPRLC